MEVAIVNSRALSGINSPLVTIEVHLSRGLPGFSIVGLPETAVKESKDRVRSALLNNQFDYPLERITVNLAPADLPKTSGRFDLPIAIGILAASGQIPANRLQDYEFAGELALTGRLRPVNGCLPMARFTQQSDRGLIIPLANAREASIIGNLDIYPAKSLNEVCAHLCGAVPIEKFSYQHKYQPDHFPDLSEVKAQHQAKRALEITAAGNHNLLMIGPPDSGKTMLAERLPGILSALEEDAALEVAAVHSISSQGFDIHSWKRRPFRSPHHTASAVALVGGGSHPKPGEISLAHFGVLFLDELPEFDRKVLEVLREPIESGKISISRAANQQTFPARFQLIAAMNPCPCGYYGDTTDRSACTPEQIRRYQTKISGPLLDRIDMHIEVPNLGNEILGSLDKSSIESSHTIQQRVIRARDMQVSRCGKLNSCLSNPEINEYCKLTTDIRQIMEKATNRFNLSARSLFRIIKVSRTIADQDNSVVIKNQHVTEALGYRRPDIYI